MTYWGSRIRLRPLEMSDLDRLASYALLPEVLVYTPYTIRSVEDVRDGLLRTQEFHRMDPQLRFDFAIERLEDARMVGDCSLQRQEPGESAWIGYQIDPSDWGHGYASEAVAALLDCAASLGCPKVETYVYTPNRASARVLEKNGFGGGEPCVRRLGQVDVEVIHFEREVQAALQPDPEPEPYGFRSFLREVGSRIMRSRR